MTQSILDVRGIGQITSVALAKHGFKTVNDLVSATVAKLAATPGFSETRAAQVINNARSLMVADDSVDTPAKVKAKAKAKAKEKKAPKSAKKTKKDKVKNKKKKKQNLKKEKDKKKDKKEKPKKANKKSKK